MAARKLAGAAIAAASNRRLIVIPPVVMARTEAVSPWALMDSAASLVRAGINEIGISAEEPPTAGGKKFV
jgi:hypothetical protein